MKYAKLFKLGGELIEAKDADYQDYYGILTCPECGEPVFLRKGFERANTQVRAAFIHHKAIPEVSVCEMRVGKYSPEHVARVAGEARDQRIRILQRHLWNFLLTSAASNMSGWRRAVKQVKSHIGFSYVFRMAEEALSINHDFIIDRLDRLALGFKENLNLVLDYQHQSVQDFVKQRKRDWDFHSRVTREALELFLKAPQFQYIRSRLMCVLAHPESLKCNSRLMELIPESEEWRQQLSCHVVQCVVMTFITVDWIEVLNVKKEEPTTKTRGFAPLAKR